MAERFVGTLRRELLDHAIVLNEHHLRRLLEQFIAYDHHGQTHLGLGRENPGLRSSANDLRVDRVLANEGASSSWSDIPIG